MEAVFLQDNEQWFDIDTPEAYENALSGHLPLRAPEPFGANGPANLLHRGGIGLDTAETDGVELHGGIVPGAPCAPQACGFWLRSARTTFSLPSFGPSGSFLFRIA